MKKQVLGTLNVNINLDGPIATLRSVLKETVARASLGLRAADTAPNEVLNLPEVLPQLRIGQQRTVDDLREPFKAWLTGALLRESIEGLEQFLWDVWRVAAFVNLPTEGGLIATPTLSSFSDRERQFLERKTLGQKIKTLRKEFPSLIPSRWDTALSGLVILRNCLSHARGVVRDTDLTSPKRLFVTWKVYEFLLEDERGRLHTMAELTRYGSPGGMLGIRSTWRRRFFRAGDRIQVGAQEFGEIAMSLLHLANDVRERLGEILKEKKLLPAEQDLTPRINILVTNISPLLAGIAPLAKRLEQELGKIEVYFSQSAETHDRIDLTIRSPDGNPLPDNLEELAEELAATLRTAVTIRPATSPPTGVRVYPPGSPPAGI